MLRASARETGRPYDLSAITHPDRDTRLPAGTELVDFVTAVIQRPADLPAARARLVETVGAAGTIRAAAVAANFQMMNRLVDATGVPIGPSLREIAAELELET